MQFKKIFITGAGGLIGSAICAELSMNGVPVRALLAVDESSENLRGLEGIEICRGDIRDASAVARLAKGCEAFIHLAALNRLWHRPAKDFYEINVEGTANACRAAIEADVWRFIYTSSCEVMGPARRGAPTDETMILSKQRVRGHYERSKFLAEETVRDFTTKGLHATIIRPTAVIGPGDIHGTPPGRLIRKFLSGKIHAYYDTGINIVDSRDVAAAHVAALSLDHTDDTYILGAHNIKFSELFKLLASESGVGAPSRKVGYTSAYLSVLGMNLGSLISGCNPGITLSGIRTIRHPWFFNTLKARRELDFHPRPLRDTIRDAIEWYENRHCHPEHQ